MSIPKGTTPTFVLTVEDIDLTTASHVYASFKGAATITKETEDLDVEAHTVSVYLSQADTLAIGKGNVLIQLNWTYEDGSRGASEIVSYPMTANLLEKVVP